ncbi:Purine nucleoside phosphorylase DeoD-type [Rubrobacter xylanophilus DSM 9941]|uniref:DeoD-type purine-nucleoside phosphorylase n=1 Tax=Rubrobacter xylanophilus TaxID=49319 RepID=UPI001C643536|nr:DeoD-type purine-nucleoside phosphorylase [Rubrobacter xylanophilus]QYJ16805.1 Purine nucleoside phosphorylase DeoD-type [Rubrobacter xylanophilus DSM 9941]
MPVHVRAKPGDFAESVLLPGDPLRAEYIARTFFENPQLVTRERGMLGYTGSYRGKPVSVQTTGMGCPSAAIVVEELIQLGARNLVRVGTCGGYHREMRLGDLVVATAAAPQDGTVSSLTRGVPYAPAAHFDIVHAAHHAAERYGRRVFVGPVVSSDLFYDPVEDPAGLWGRLGVLAVEMEAAAIFTIAAMRGVRAGCLLTVSDTIGEEVVRISDEDLRAAVDDMVELALDTLHGLN